MTEGLDAVGELSAISRTGMFVETDELPRPGAVVALQFWTPSGDLVDLRGEVRWNTQGLAHAAGLRGFGVLVHEAPQSYRQFFIWAQAEKSDDLEPE